MTRDNATKAQGAQGGLHGDALAFAVSAGGGFDLVVVAVVKLLLNVREGVHAVVELQIHAQHGAGAQGAGLDVPAGLGIGHQGAGVAEQVAVLLWVCRRVHGQRLWLGPHLTFAHTRRDLVLADAELVAAAGAVRAGHQRPQVRMASRQTMAIELAPMTTRSCQSRGRVVSPASRCCTFHSRPPWGGGLDEFYKRRLNIVNECRKYFLRQCRKGVDLYLISALGLQFDV